MKTLSVVLICICTIIFAIIGGLFVAFAFDLFSLQELTEVLNLKFNIANINFIIGSIGVFLFVATFFFARISLGKMQREKTIAFNNPDGQVTISLTAIEDFIKRLSSTLTEIKDLRSNVTAGKKGLDINTRVSLWAESNIPETTENIQGIIKNRIQEMLGIEEPITVRVHVGKIVQREKKQAKGKEKDKKGNAGQASSFHGSIEYGK